MTDNEEATKNKDGTTTYTPAGRAQAEQERAAARKARERYEKAMKRKPPTDKEIKDMFEKKHSVIDLQFDSPDDVLMHFGVRGMKWGVRRAVGPNGLALGKPPGIAKKSGSDTVSVKVTRGKRGQGSADHQRLVKNLDKKVENLSTADIKAITARIQAINQLKAETAKERAAKASMSKKIVKWALNQVVEGATDRVGKIVKEHAGDFVQDIIPKSKTQQAKNEETRQKNIKFEQSQEDRAAKKARESGSTPPKDRDTAVKDLADAVLKSDGAYEITTKKKGG